MYVHQWRVLRARFPEENVLTAVWPEPKYLQPRKSAILQSCWVGLTFKTKSPFSAAEGEFGGFSRNLKESVKKARCNYEVATKEAEGIRSVCAHFLPLAESFTSGKTVVAIQISVSYHIWKNDSQNRQATFSKDFFTFKLRNKDLWKMSLDSRKQRAGSYLCAAWPTAMKCHT